MRNFRRKIAEAKSAVSFAWQRVTRGWDNTAFWATDHWLCKNLGEILIHAANHAHGYPNEYPGEHAAWTRDMRRAGVHLMSYADYHDALAKFDEYDVIENDAREALHWVADHLPSLWD